MDRGVLGDEIDAGDIPARSGRAREGESMGVRGEGAGRDGAVRADPRGLIPLT